ncbi:hypothetical protein HPP92_023877 [Vanilla planifolia]|uniref:NAC domain-containing protein n=1 Tax=Vanilla planifolia TaxID=51239 RepID=A0A835UB10_VANPL|nr:hypothetical protein HPP92_023877 [Vanilla planifolia]
MESNCFPGSHFPPGFRFHPTDQELVGHYLRKKISSSLPPSSAIIADIDLYKFNPWELPEKAYFGEKEWFFFSPRDRKYPNGFRPNRAAGLGYWKATGTDKPILAADGIQCIGVKKALVFYMGRPPKGTKTEWVMSEYRLLDATAPLRNSRKQDTMRLDDWVLCRVKKKGRLPGEAGESKRSPPSASVVHSSSREEKRQEEWAMARGRVLDWNDAQLLGYLLSSPENGETSRGEESDISNYLDLQQGSPQDVATSCISMKRKSSSSFPELDELTLLQPTSKRLQCSSDGALWGEDSFAINYCPMEFLF